MPIHRLAKDAQARLDLQREDGASYRGDRSTAEFDLGSSTQGRTHQSVPAVGNYGSPPLVFNDYQKATCLKALGRRDQVASRTEDGHGVSEQFVTAYSWMPGSGVN